MLVLGIESSCDETGVALYDSAAGLIGNALYSQVDLHAQFGGVVPELAARDHMRRLLPLVRYVMSEADRELGALDAVAYTAGPGLAGALLTGAAFARSLAYARGLPAVAIHHMEGHLLAPMLAPDPPRFPFVSLLVSGGHTMLVEARSLGRYQVLGESLDDAAGEAFDKTAKLLGLGYPGGPAVARLAEGGRPGAFRLPRPMLDRPGLDFSFSGLKTAVALASARVGEDPAGRADLAREFEEAVVETLVAKCRRALQQTGLARLVVAGGVSANRRLRGALDALARETGASVHFPRLDLCTDNGAMVAYAGALRFAEARRRPLGFAARARWEIAALRPPADHEAPGG